MLHRRLGGPQAQLLALRILRHSIAQGRECGGGGGSVCCTQADRAVGQQRGEASRVQRLQLNVPRQSIVQRQQAVGMLAGPLLQQSRACKLPWTASQPSADDCVPPEPCTTPFLCSPAHLHVQAALQEEAQPQEAADGEAQHGQARPQERVGPPRRHAGLALCCPPRLHSQALLPLPRLADVSISAAAAVPSTLGHGSLRCTFEASFLQAPPPPVAAGETQQPPWSSAGCAACLG